MLKGIIPLVRNWFMLCDELHVARHVNGRHPLLVISADVQRCILRSGDGGLEIGSEAEVHRSGILHSKWMQGA